MDLSHQTEQQRMADPFYRRLHRIFLACCILLAPLWLFAWFWFCPTGAGDASCPDQGSSQAVFVAFRVMNPQLMQLFLLLSFIAPYIYTLSYVGLGLLAMKRSPWLATVGIACGFAAGIVWGPIAGQIALIYGMAQIGPNPAFVTIEHAYYTNWMTLAFGICWVIGHVFGYILLGIALARARVIPLWAASLISVSAILMGPIAYGLNQGLLQVLGYLLVFIGSVPAALALLKMKGGQEPTPSIKHV